MRRAPPTVPGTPMSPSIPPRSFFAQKVIIRPRSAAASTCARLPLSTTSGSARTSCRTTQGSSPSPTSKFEPPPRNLCGTWFASRRFKRSGRLSCRLMRSKSVVPPMPKDVRPASAAPCFSSTFISASLATILGSRMRMGYRMLRSKQNHEFIAGPADIASADGKDGVSGTRLLQQVLDTFLHGVKIVDVLVAGLANGARKRLARHSRDWRFAGRVDVEQHENVRLIKSATEFVPKVLRAGVAMGLKEHEQAIELAAACRFERGANRGGVMTIIIDHGDVIDDTLDVKAAAHPSKLDEAFADQVRRNIQIKCDGRRRRCVADIVHARRVRELEQAEIFALVSQPELAAQTFQRHVADHQISLARRSVRNDGTLHTGNDGLHVGLIDTQDRRTVKWHAIHKLDEGVLNILERGVLVEVFAINRCHDCDYGREHQEAAVALVRFHHKIFPFAEPRRRACLVYFSADDKRGVEVRRSQYRSDDRGRSRLAVRASYGDAVFQAHQLREHLRARNYRNFHLVRFDDFGVICLHGGGSHDNVRAIGVGSLVTFVHRGAEILETFGDRGRLGVRAGDSIAQRQEHFGDTAHTEAADANQVDALKIAERNHHALAPCRFPSTFAASSMRFTMSRAALGRASPRAAVDSFSISWGWSRREKISAVSRSAVSSTSEIRRPAPARDISCALRSWWLSVALPNGMKMAARPAAAISAAVMAPARQTIISAQAKRSAMLVRKGTTSALISRRAYAVRTAL